MKIPSHGSRGATLNARGLTGSAHGIRPRDAGQKHIKAGQHAAGGHRLENSPALRIRLLIVHAWRASVDLGAVTTRFAIALTFFQNLLRIRSKRRPTGIGQGE
ncbi:hypothetical protein [Salinisphaera hydrothermalis]|uniref:hypothetical protein n=1 Tax=Salinisphaera TaxID=180541 RepID=UPI003340F581